MPSAALGGISSPCCICEQAPPNLRGALRWKGGQNLDKHHSPAWEPAQPQARPQISPRGLRDLSQLFCPSDLHPIASAPFPTACQGRGFSSLWDVLLHVLLLQPQPPILGTSSSGHPLGAGAAQDSAHGSPSIHGHDTHLPSWLQRANPLEAALGLDAKAGQLSLLCKNAKKKTQQTPSASRSIIDSLFFSA